MKGLAGIMLTIAILLLGLMGTKATSSAKMTTRADDDSEHNIQWRVRHLRDDLHDLVSWIEIVCLNDMRGGFLKIFQKGMSAREIRRLGGTSQLPVRGNALRLEQSSVAEFKNFNLSDEGNEGKLEEPLIIGLEDRQGRYMDEQAVLAIDQRGTRGEINSSSRSQRSAFRSPRSSFICIDDKSTTE
jgi:hypothetical protein